MDIGAIIQVRMSSRRFPGKVLHVVEGRPLLLYIVEKLRRIKELKVITVATSDNKEDDPIEGFCTDNGVACYRGDLDNVIARFCGALSMSPVDAFVRVNGDSPLIDGELIRKGMAVFGEGIYDIVTNVFPRSYPKGQSVEVVASRVFTETARRIAEKDDQEHVTRYFYNNADGFKIHNIASDKDLSDIQLSVDTQEDMNTFSALVSRMDRPHWAYGVEEVLRLYNLVMIER